MALIRLADASVEYPIYSAGGRSLKSAVLSTIGGKIGVDKSSRVVVKALRNISITIENGERIALLGGNGSGKSTMLKVLAGIIEPSSGTAVIDGRVSALLDLSMGMDMEATGYENIIMRSTFLGATFDEAKSLVSAIADFSGLGEYLSFPVRTYSSGMVVRLSFAISTASVSDILVMDEHVGAADVAFSNKSKMRLKDITGRSKIVVFATHDFNAAMDLCQRGVVLSSGDVVFDGPVADALGYYEKIALAAIAEANAAEDTISRP
jgi:ABC-type polysaccharide/polyol phosphate transport system ATPase subunit